MNGKPFRKRGDGAMFCYKCDAKQPSGAKKCFVCGSVAFYRVRRPGGAREETVKEA